MCIRDRTTIITAITTPELAVDGGAIIDRYHSSGTAEEQAGWKVLEVGADKAAEKTASKRKSKATEPLAEGDASQTLPPSLTVGQWQRVLDARAEVKQTRRPPSFTEATLLTAMETSGRTLEAKELSAAMKYSGLGTPATLSLIHI